MLRALYDSRIISELELRYEELTYVDQFNAGVLKPEKAYVYNHKS